MHTQKKKCDSALKSQESRQSELQFRRAKDTALLIVFGQNNELKGYFISSVLCFTKAYLLVINCLLEVVLLVLVSQQPTQQAAVFCSIGTFE